MKHGVDGFVLSERVIEIKYRHAEDGEDYVHGFKSAVVMILVTNARGQREIRLVGRQGQPLWGTTEEIADGEFEP